LPFYTISDGRGLGFQPVATVGALPTVGGAYRTLIPWETGSAWFQPVFLAYVGGAKTFLACATPLEVNVLSRSVLFAR